jgi:hypothetical protein
LRGRRAGRDLARDTVSRPARQPRCEAARKLADQVSSEVCKLLESSSMSYKEGAKLLEAQLSASV